MRFQRLILITAMLAATLLAPIRAAFAHDLCFPDKTPYCMQDPFSDYWERNGGLPVFGYPVTAAEPEVNPDTGATYATQWVERNRLEDHPENAGTPYRVLLGLLGKERLAQIGRDWQAEGREAGPQAGCLWFAETGHNVCDQAQGVGFKTYWETHGLAVAGLDRYARSLQLFGLPLTEPRMETNSSGDTVLTQWFERARFEWHPNNPANFKVLLGLLGKEVLAGRAAGGSVDRVQLYVIGIGQGNLGCGDGLAPFEVRIAPTSRPLTAAISALLGLGERPVAGTDLYNALAISDLALDSAAVDAGGVATINLTGQVRLNGVCDAPRITEQLRATAMQFPTVRDARFFVNGVPLDQVLSER